MIDSVFKGLCPNCGGDITSNRLELGIPCERCMPDGEVLVEGELLRLKRVEAKVREWEAFFEERIGFSPWSLQVSWAKRILLGHSFALLAPTGVGKSSFGLSMATFLAREGKRSYIILPTRMLVEQTVRKLYSMGLSHDDLLYFGDETSKRKEIKKERLLRGDFKVLVSTSMFLYKNQDSIPKDFDFIFVDDVDSFLKTAKNVDKVLYLLGFLEDDVELAMKVIRLKEARNKEEKDWKDIKELSEELRRRSKKTGGVLVVSSATSSPRSSRIKLFRELLGFEVGMPTFYLRNVVDLYTPLNQKTVEKWVKKLGKGGLIFVSSDLGKDQVDRVVNELRSKDIKAVSYEELNEEVLRKYEEGEIDVLVGIASYRNPLARGFDMPHAVRYALFYGVPKMVISLKFEKSLSHLLWALASVRSLLAKNMPSKIKEVDRWLEQLKRYQYLSEEYLSTKPELQKKVDSLRESIGEFLSSEDVLRLIETSEEISLRKTPEGYVMVLSDATGYLQASGRTSRMFAGGISKGLSLTLVDDQRAFKHLQKKVRWFNEELNFKSLEEDELKEILFQIDQNREKIKRLIKGEEKPEGKELLKPTLIVVESPNKAKTIANFFGRAVGRRVGNHELLETSVEDRYLMITASLGHVLDLSKEGGFHGVEVNRGVVPIYEPIEGKEELLKSLGRMAFEAQEVLIATDPDTEGEKIGWDIGELLKPINGNIKRIEFHEVTRKALMRALKEPREFDQNLVKAQIVRRIADRWVGFEFSRLLQEHFGKAWLSAGRVQTPVLGWIIKREEEYKRKVYKVTLYLSQDRRLRLEWEFQNKEEAQLFYDNLESCFVEVIGEREEIKNPPAPFATHTMLKATSDHYRWSLPKTMNLAQTLFELGFITYHRTDSTRVSDYGIGVAKEYIREEFGEEYFSPRGWAEGGAHECIRPTKPLEPEELRAMVYSGQVEGLTKEHIMLYELIFRRFMASQMRAVRLKVWTLRVLAGAKTAQLDVAVEVLEDGWNRVLRLELFSPELGSIPLEGRKEIKTQPKAYLYTHGELVQEMKERGIGRPSTYASIVEKLMERGYVIENKGFLIPTKLGKEIYAYLSQREDIHLFLREEFTSHLEELMDKVEEGKEDYIALLKDLYKDIIEVEKKLEVVL